MNLFFIIIGFCGTLSAMDSLYRLQKAFKKKQILRIVRRELSEPIFEKEKGELFYFVIDDGPLSDKEQKYIKMLKEKMEKEKLREERKAYEKKLKIEKWYQRLSILCLVLGHIACVLC